MAPTLRLTKPATREAFLVNLDRGTVFAPTPERTFGLAQPLQGPAADQALTAARELAKAPQGPHAGAWTSDETFMSGGVVNSRELQAFDGGTGIPLARTALAKHLDFFDQGGAHGDRTPNGYITPRENFAGWKSLQNKTPVALVKAALSSLVFGNPKKGFAIDIERIAARRPKESTHIFDAEQLIDTAKLAEYRAAFDAAGGTLSTDKVLQLVKDKSHAGTVSQGQFRSLFELCEKLNGNKTVTGAQFEEFYEGSLLWDAKARFAAQVPAGH